MKNGIALGVAAFSMLGAGGAAQTLPQASAAQSPLSSQSQTAATIAVKAGTPIVIDIIDPLNSKTAKIGQTFALRLAEPVTDESGHVVLPAGLLGEGEVIHAAKGAMSGRAGELILAARHLDCGSLAIPIGHMKFSETGGDASSANSWAVALGAPYLMHRGGEVYVATGTRADAKINADESRDAIASAGCDVVAPGKPVAVSESEGGKQQ